MKLTAEKAKVCQTPQTLCWKERFVFDAAVATSYTSNHVACSSSEPEKDDHERTFAIKEQTFALVQCLASVALKLKGRS